MANFQTNQETHSFDCDGYSSFLTSGLYELYTQKTFCDITISVGHRSFLTHKTVLSVISPYFKTMFTSGFQEAGSSAITIAGDGETFESLLRFAYTGNLQLSEATVRDVLSMACYMQIDKVLQLCEQYVSKMTSEKLLTFDTACMLLTLAASHSLQEMSAMLRRYLVENVIEFSQIDLFFDVQTADVVLDCFRNSNAMAHLECSEEKILNIMLSWMRHDWYQRKEHAESLLKHVRLCLVSVEYLKELIDDDELPGCKTLLAEALQIREASKGVNPLTLARKYPSLCAPRGLTTALMLTTRPYACYYDTTRRRWVPFSFSPPTYRSPLDYTTNHTMIVVNDELYAAGGLVEPVFNATNNFCKYNAVTNTWDALERMNEACFSCALAELDGYIYAFSTHQTSVERYSISEGKWSNPGEVSPLLESVSNISAVALNGCILVYGGSVLDGILQVYIPSTNTWYMQGFAITDPLDNREYISGDVRPLLTTHEDKCYLVTSLDIDSPPRLIVFQWDISFDAGMPLVTFGEKQSQDLVSEYDKDVFVIEDDVFVIVNGYIHNTGIKVEDRESFINLEEWCYFFDKDLELRNESVVYYTFDRLRLCEKKD